MNIFQLSILRSKRRSEVRVCSVWSSISSDVCRGRASALAGLCEIPLRAVLQSPGLGGLRHAVRFLRPLISIARYRSIPTAVGYLRQEYHRIPRSVWHRAQSEFRVLSCVARADVGATGADRSSLSPDRATARECVRKMRIADRKACTPIWLQVPRCPAIVEPSGAASISTSRLPESSRNTVTEFVL